MNDKRLAMTAATAAAIMRLRALAAALINIALERNSAYF